MIDKLPHLAIPLINEVFSRQYSDSEPVTALQNEHMEILDDKVITDSYLKIADKYYHVEYQSSPDGTRAIRMIEYDFLIPLKHAEKNGYEYTLHYPYSCVLYLRCTDRTPDVLTVHVKFSNGVSADYQIPIIKVNRYSLEEIFQKKLLFLVPYYIMRYETVLSELEKEDEKLQELLTEYQHIYQKPGVLCDENVIAAYDFMELKHLMEAIMRTLKLSLEKACEAMETTVGDYTKAKHLILDQKKV